MITGVQDVYYNVSDMERARAFYTGLLGFRELDTSPYWTSLELGGLRVGLHWSEGEPVPPVPRDSHGAHAGATLTLRSDDPAADRARLEAAGAVILGEDAAPWGHLVVFEDPDGNVLKLMRPAS
ncbi:MAG: VOC family protein [Planctomycetota bacterium]